MFAALVLLADLARAGQLAWNLEERGDLTTLDARWTDAAGRPRALRADVPTAAIQADLDEPVALDLRTVNTEVVARVNAWARHSETPVKARTQRASIEMEVTAGSRGEAERARAIAARPASAIAARSISSATLPTACCSRAPIPTTFSSMPRVKRPASR